MEITILNSLTGDDKSELDTSQPEGREQAAKLVGELLRSGSAVFMEREVNGETYTYRVTGYDPATNKLTIRLDSNQITDEAIAVEQPRRKGKGRPRGIARGACYGRIAPEAGRTVAVAPRSGG